MVAHFVERPLLELEMRSAVRIPTSQNVIYQLYIEIEKDGNKEKEARNGPSLKNKCLITGCSKFSFSIISRWRFIRKFHPYFLVPRVSPGNDPSRPRGMFHTNRKKTIGRKIRVTAATTFRLNYWRL